MEKTKKFASLILVSGMLLGISAHVADSEDLVKTGGATVAGFTVGYGVVTATNMSACSIVGGGMGLGAAATPIGVAVGALAGLAVCGVYKIFNAEEK